MSISSSSSRSASTSFSSMALTWLLFASLPTCSITTKSHGSQQLTHQVLRRTRIYTTLTRFTSLQASPLPQSWSDVKTPPTIIPRYTPPTSSQTAQYTTVSPHRKKRIIHTTIISPKRRQATYIIPTVAHPHARPKDTERMNNTYP
ncbi:hypothetical protein HBI56_076630 [Parastagonospora nodorum]|nr:hypothetical protein HBI10_059960 [Parastagonospora nodorum]KAH4028942.1 hypothetical protein HBI13_042420 [Parastagonospora nodorum]KAH4054138.1 hypothetical protein HBH49_076380 [Parastagonospora nodorum]KAH4210661.1 hypothetical protein HBI95_062560 [Parastagonospora nodorum]KAH4225970.1 hypothetical protein HBI06_114560 [Parastagonospora nodorum]